MPSARIASFAAATALLASLCACSSSTGSDAGSGLPDASHDGPTNGCLAYGKSYGYVCAAGSSCGAGYTSTEDYSCGATGELCCAPMGEGGLDASDDVNVFVDGAVFETGSLDAGPSDAGTADAAPDVTTGADAASDAGHDGAPADATAG